MDLKRQEAESRDRDHDILTIPERITKAESRRGESKRELARLAKMLAVQKPPAVKIAPLTEEQKSVKAVKRAKDSVAVTPKAKKTTKTKKAKTYKPSDDSLASHESFA